MSSPSSSPALQGWRRPLVGAVALLALLSGAVACGDDDGDDAGAATTEAATESSADDASDPAAAADAPTSEGDDEVLSVVVTNDDGYDAEGIDAVVEALEAEGDIEITVVAPLEQQSGQGGTYTEGPLETQEEQTASGTDVIAVDGFPADAVRVALEELDLTPDLLVSGINEGQNLGPVVDISGTVGAARAAVAAGVPGLALSSGTEGFDYEAGVPFMLDWIEENREALIAGDAPVEVVSINTPSCTEGEIRGLAEVPVGTDGRQALSAQDCTSTLEDPPDDTTAFNNGFATLTVLSDDPETPYQPG